MYAAAGSCVLFSIRRWTIQNGSPVKFSLVYVVPGIPSTEHGDSSVICSMSSHHHSLHSNIKNIFNALSLLSRNFLSTSQPAVSQSQRVFILLVSPSPKPRYILPCSWCVIALQRLLKQSEGRQGFNPTFFAQHHGQLTLIHASHPS